MGKISGEISIGVPKFAIHITPVPKPRMTRSDKWKERPSVVRYRAFGDELRLNLGTSYRLPPAFAVEFVMPMPSSWSAKERDRLSGKPHQQTPDIDNLCKSLLDHLAKEDKYIWHIEASKYWATTNHNIGEVIVQHLA